MMRPMSGGESGGSYDRLRCSRCATLVRSEYQEMPGLALTEAQVARLWRFDRALALGVLGQLQREGFLRRTVNGMYVRADLARP